jgi:hypothetical protein
MLMTVASSTTINDAMLITANVHHRRTIAWRGA